MGKLTFTTTINAPVSKVRHTMLDKTTYEQRTTIFCEGSTYDWSREQGASIKFTDPQGYGMIAEIAENRPNEFISIRHLWEMMKDEKTSESKVTMYDAWTHTYENYTFSEQDGVTTVVVDMDGLPEEYLPMFEEMRPKSLEKLKEICEQ